MQVMLVKISLREGLLVVVEVVLVAVETVVEVQVVEVLVVVVPVCAMNFRGVAAREVIRVGMLTLLRVAPEAGEAVFHSRALAMKLRGQRLASRQCMRTVQRSQIQARTISE